ncbi:U4/U6.U5 tri-snRNP-associated protein 1 [Leptinotarsa decemlineata]|uniref:U4/U6.U5 tri-snRNP-associated protein 1 n=1 Tax=Leptinotarsa decemlineata TaxID=7539 RepID=UPI003D30B62F
MGSSTKKKDKESRKRRREESHDSTRDKRHKHKKHHHKEKKHKSSKHVYETEENSSRRRYEPEEKSSKYNYESDGSDVVEIVENAQQAPPSPPAVPPLPTLPQHSSKDIEAASSSQGAESLSIEETNKLRAKLGLKPLQVASSASNSSTNSNKKGNNELKKDDLGEFYHKPAENLQLKAQQEKLRAKLSEIREKRQLNNKYSKVKTLGEGSDDEDDILSWVDKSREIDKAKKDAEKRARMLEELDSQFGINDIVESERREKMRSGYTAKHLKGLTVQHDLDSFGEGRSVVLTLKDKGVLEDDEDVLVNVNMIDDERYKKNIENKKTVHNTYEDEFDEYGNFQEKPVLSKYNEEVASSFKIGYDNGVQRKQAAMETLKAKLNKNKLESIADKNLTLVSDYYNEEELAKFKKPKKKKVRSIRSKGKLLTMNEIKPDNAGIEAIGSRRPKIKNETDYDIDDLPAVNIPTDIKLEEENDSLLERALHNMRRKKQKEDVIADIIKTEVKTEPEEENVDGGTIVLNATAEFCRTLGDIPTYGKSGNREEADELMEDYEKDTIMAEENSDDDCEIIEPTNGWNSVDPSNQGIDSSQINPQDVQILDEEPDVSTGVGAALKLAMSKGYLDKEQNNRPSNSRFAHLQAKHYSIEDKSYGEDGGDRQNRRERYAGPITEFREKESFKPNVKLEYIDDDGHILSSKEAFRYLSHKFHGKGPSKNKIEKRIKKGVQEQLMKKMSSTDTPLGTLNMLQAKQKESQSPFVVLSGNKQTQSTALSKTRR